MSKNKITVYRIGLNTEMGAEYGAFDEEGTKIARHFCSSTFSARIDLSNQNSFGTYDKRYPDGWELIMKVETYMNPETGISISRENKSATIPDKNIEAIKELDKSLKEIIKAINDFSIALKSSSSFVEALVESEQECIDQRREIHGLKDELSSLNSPEDDEIDMNMNWPEEEKNEVDNLYNHKANK